jgi:hypothetical protein
MAGFALPEIINGISINILFLKQRQRSSKHVQDMPPDVLLSLCTCALSFTCMYNTEVKIAALL